MCIYLIWYVPQHSQFLVESYINKSVSTWTKIYRLYEKNNIYFNLLLFTWALCTSLFSELSATNINTNYNTIIIWWFCFMPETHTYVYKGYQNHTENTGWMWLQELGVIAASACDLSIHIYHYHIFYHFKFRFFESFYLLWKLHTGVFIVCTFHSAYDRWLPENSPLRQLSTKKRKF